jgi:hypothetical protein
MPYANTLTSAQTATETFWPMIAGYGIPYNLLILRRVTDTRFAALNKMFGDYGGYLKGLPEQLLREGRLYEIDFSMFESLLAWRYSVTMNKRLRCNPKVQAHYSHYEVTGNRGRVAVSRGPLIYCAEEADNGGNLDQIATNPEVTAEVSQEDCELGEIVSLSVSGSKEEQTDGLLIRYQRR